MMPSIVHTPGGRYSKPNTPSRYTKLPSLEGPRRPNTVTGGRLSPTKGMHPRSLYSMLNRVSLTPSEKARAGVNDWKHDHQLSEWYQDMLVRKKEEKARCARKAQKEDEKVMRMIEAQMAREETKKQREVREEEIHKAKSKAQKPGLSGMVGLKAAGLGASMALSTLKRLDTMKSTDTSTAVTSPTVDNHKEPAKENTIVQPKDDASDEEDDDTEVQTSALQWRSIDLPEVETSRVKEVAVWVNPGVFHTKKVAY